MFAWDLRVTEEYSIMIPKAHQRLETAVILQRVGKLVSIAEQVALIYVL